MRCPYNYCPSREECEFEGICQAPEEDVEDRDETVDDFERLLDAHVMESMR